MKLVTPKYYILGANRKPIRAVNRSVWEDWMATADPVTLLLARHEFENVTIETSFKGVVYDGLGAYETVVSSASSERPTTVRRYPGLSSGQALAGHLGFVEELRSSYEHSQDN